MNELLELLAIVGFIGWAVIAWVLLGRWAHARGLSRAKLIAGAVLFGWLIG